MDSLPERIEAAEGPRRNYILPKQGLFGVWIFGRYVTLKSSRHREYFSERNRRGCKVIYLPFGWRLTFKTGATQ